MSRKPRVAISGVAMHVMQRGNNRMQCFRVESDYLLYLANLRQLSADFECGVHAYCLMPNHVHLLLTPVADTGCSGLMKNLGQRYTQYFNARYGRTGTLWEGRYRSSVVESSRYVIACYRYIELNPVRAGLVSDPSAWLWSSHAVNAGSRCDPMVVPHAEFEALGLESSGRAAAYGRLVRENVQGDLLAQIRDAVNGGYPLASGRVAAALAASGHKLVPGKAGRPGKRNRGLTPI